MEFWIAGQILVDILFCFLLIRFFKMIKSRDSGDVYGGKIAELTQIMEPVLRDAEGMATRFESQLREKHRLIRKLNEHLDDRIISLNLLLNRADLHISESSDKKPVPASPDVLDQQKKIIALAGKGIAPEEIARQVSISAGEVLLVLDLKKKFVQMETAEGRIR